MPNPIRRRLLAGLAALPAAGLVTASSYSAPAQATPGINPPVHPDAALLDMERRYLAALGVQLDAWSQQEEADNFRRAVAHRINPTAEPSTDAWADALRQAARDPAVCAAKQAADARSDAANAPRNALLDQISDTPATTFDGIVSKARVARFTVRDRWSDEEDIAASLVSDLLALVGTPDWGAVQHVRPGRS